MGRKKRQKNYLDLVPERAKQIIWETDEDGMVVLQVENTGVFNRIAQKVFGRPKYTNVHMDKYGSFLWPLIDGKKTVMELAELEKEAFGEEAEPLYPRIVKYFQIVESYHFIRFKTDLELP
ncbi:MAG: PqqD family protein [Lachnospiraceae bacterium]|nr:PqqD family protein [Lachnospiraceae bacterium]